METKKYTKEELEQMVASSGFAYGTPARQAAEANASEYDFDSDTLDVRECVEDAYIYGIIWCLEHLK
jgi:hypothetical protein